MWMVEGMGDDSPLKANSHILEIFFQEDRLS